MDLRIRKKVTYLPQICGVTVFLRTRDNCQVCVDSIDGEQNIEEYYDIFFILQEI